MTTKAGTVKWLNISKGYGFTAQEPGPDVFANFNAMVGESRGRKSLYGGRKVQFTVTQGRKKPAGVEHRRHPSNS